MVAHLSTQQVGHKKKKLPSALGKVMITKYFLHGHYTHMHLLHYSIALHGRLETVQILLVKCSYKGNSADSCGVTPLMDAARGDHAEVIKFLLHHSKVRKCLLVSCC